MLLYKKHTASLEVNLDTLLSLANIEDTCWNPGKNEKMKALGTYESTYKAGAFYASPLCRWSPLLSVKQ